MTADVKSLVERAKRWAVDTGYDGGPNSVPMQMIAALTAQAEEIERLRAALSGKVPATISEANAALDAALKAAQEVKHV